MPRPSICQTCPSISRPSPHDCQSHAVSRPSQPLQTNQAPCVHPERHSNPALSDPHNTCRSAASSTCATMNRVSRESHSVPSASTGLRCCTPDPPPLMALPLSWRKAQRFASPMHSSATNCKSTYAGSYSSGAIKQRRCVRIRLRSHHSAAHKHPALICLAVEVSRLSSSACSDLALPLQCMPLRSGHGASFLQPWAPILRPLPLQRMPLRSGQRRVNTPWASSSAQHLCSACRFAAATVQDYTNLSLLQECSATHTAAIGGGALQNKGVAHPRPSSSADG